MRRTWDSMWGLYTTGPDTASAGPGFPSADSKRDYELGSTRVLVQDPCPLDLEDTSAGPYEPWSKFLVRGLHGDHMGSLSRGYWAVYVYIYINKRSFDSGLYRLQSVKDSSGHRILYGIAFEIESTLWTVRPYGFHRDPTTLAMLKVLWIGAMKRDFSGK